MYESEASNHYSQREYQEANLKFIQNDLDAKLVELIIPMYRHISVNFEHDFNYKNMFLDSVEKRVKKMYKYAPNFVYKNFFELVMGKTVKELNNDILKTHLGYRVKLEENLETLSNPVNIFECLSSSMYDELAEFENMYRIYSVKIYNSLSAHYLDIVGNQELINRKFLESFSRIKLIETYINCVKKSFEKKLEYLIVDFSGSSNYIYDMVGTYEKRNELENSIIDLISANLIAIYKFLLLKKKDGTSLIDDENQIYEYFSEMRNYFIDLLLKKNVVSNRIIDRIYSGISDKDNFVSIKYFS